MDECGGRSFVKFVVWCKNHMIWVGPLIKFLNDAVRLDFFLWC